MGYQRRVHGENSSNYLMPGRVSRKKDSSKVEYRDKAVKLTIDISQAVEEDVIEQGHFIDFLKNNMKVGGKKGNLEYVSIEAAQNKVVVATKVQFGKRYLKYLTKKYLKQQDINSYLRVVASDKLGYKVKFLNIQDNAGGEE